MSKDFIDDNGKVWKSANIHTSIDGFDSNNYMPFTLREPPESVIHVEIFTSIYRKEATGILKVFLKSADTGDEWIVLDAAGPVHRTVRVDGIHAGRYLFYAECPDTMRYHLELKERIPYVTEPSPPRSNFPPPKRKYNRSR
jgi:hypothetical protein